MAKVKIAEKTRQLGIFALLLPLLLSMIYGGCSGSSGSKCALDEYRAILATSKCLAEEMLIACDRSIGCRGFDPSFQTFLLNDCSFVDCETLSCTSLFIDGVPEPGFLTELTFDDTIDYPVGIYQVDGLEGEFTCDVFTVE